MKTPSPQTPARSPFPPAWAAWAARVALGALLAASGAMKAAAPAEEFAVVIENYDLLPRGMVLPVAHAIPWLEVVVGFSLIGGYFTRQASAAAGALLLSFCGALLSVKLRGIELPNCGCFGSSFHLTTVQALLFDAVLLALAFLSFKKGGEKLSLDNWAGGGYTSMNEEKHPRH